MARFKRSTFDVWTRDPLVEDNPEEMCTRVEVEWTDQLRGELEAHKQGITSDAPMNLANVWVWCAMARLGLTDRKYPDWKANELVGLEKVKDADAADVDPTEAGPSTGSP